MKGTIGPVYRSLLECQCAMGHKYRLGRGMWDVGGSDRIWSAVKRVPPPPTSHLRFSDRAYRPNTSTSIVKGRHASVTYHEALLPEHVPPAARERVVQDLADHFAQDRLTMPEYERRVELAYRADSTDALRELTRDLVPLMPAQMSQPAAMTSPSAVSASVTTRAKNFFALMSGVVRRGKWTVPSRMRAIACMGGIGLDLREATLTAPVTDIYVFALMGGVEIIVPPNVRLETDGFAIMGGFEDQLKEPASADPNVPMIRVHGLAIMGGVEARVAEPGEKTDLD